MRQKWLLSYTLYLLGWLFISPLWAWTIPSHEQEAALELEPNLENGRRIYEKCAICHTPMGWGTPDGRYPEIAGQHRKVIIKQLADIRAGNRDNPTMYPFTLDSSVGGIQGIADVAAYIAQLPMSPSNTTGPGFHLELGKEVYEEHCAECHGDNGEGDNDEFYPSLYGQHYDYMMRQTFWILSGRRRNSDETMVNRLEELSLREIQASIDYASRLRPPEDKVAEPNWWNPDFPKDFVSVPSSPYRPRPLFPEYPDRRQSMYPYPPRWESMPQQPSMR